MSAWKSCVICKNPIDFNSAYYRCSVSGCKSERKGIVFCSVPCWDEHRAVFGHRSAWAEEERSPATGNATAAGERIPKRMVVSPQPSAFSSAQSATRSTSAVSSSAGSAISYDTLVVVSKVKKLVRDLSDYNTSQCAIDALTEKVVQECKKAIEGARTSGRKTIMGRDFEK